MIYISGKLQLLNPVLNCFLLVDFYIFIFIFFNFMKYFVSFDSLTILNVKLLLYCYVSLKGRNKTKALGALYTTPMNTEGTKPRVALNGC